MQDTFEKHGKTGTYIWSYFNKGFYIRKVYQGLVMFSDYPGLYRKDTCVSESGKVILDETERRIRVGHGRQTC